jgi:hypothetical protein
MKKLFTLLAVSVLLAVGSAFAQIASDQTLGANIPFSFILGKTTLPAGHYTIQSVGNSGKAVLIRGSYRQSGIFLLAIDTESTQPSAQSSLTFNKYGNQYFLSRIQVEGSTRGLQLPKSRAEKEMEMAGNNTGQKLVLVAQVR